MKTRLLLFLAVIAGIISCQKELANENGTLIPPSTTAQLQKKWTLPSVNNLNYDFIEFAPGSTYIILQQDGASKTGKYNVSADGKTITLEGLGTVEVSSLSDTAFNFSMRLSGSTTAVTANSIVAAQRPGSPNADLLCQDWNLYKSYDFVSTNQYDSIYYPQTYQDSSYGMIKGEVIFSSYGTYFATTIEKNASGADTSYLNGVWNWTSASQTAIRYTDATDTLNTGLLDIQELSTTNLRWLEDSSIYFLNH